MPSTTPKLGIKKPLGTETVNRAAFNENYDLIDQNAALDAFIPKSATYDATNDKIDVVFGKGRADFGGGSIVETAADTTVSIAAPEISTVYYIFLNENGTFSYATTAAPAPGQVRIASVATGATVDALTLTDLRGILPGVAVTKAAQVPIEDSGGNFVADNVEGALGEEADARQSHEAETAQAHGFHDSQDVVINCSGGKVSSIVSWKPTTAGVKRIEALLTYDSNGRLNSVDEKVYDTDGVTVQSRAITTYVRDANTGQILRAEVRPA